MLDRSTMQILGTSEFLWVLNFHWKQTHIFINEGNTYIHHEYENKNKNKLQKEQKRKNKKNKKGGDSSLISSSRPLESAEFSDDVSHLEVVKLRFHRREDVAEVVHLLPQLDVGV